MRFYPTTHAHTCGIDLHARTIYVCVLDAAGKVVLHRNLPACPTALLDALAPFREDLVIGVECMFSWYWLADLCSRQKIPFVLGHARYMKAIHGAKSKTARIDALKIAKLLRGGMFPIAYVYPRPMRATRDLLRRRLVLVRHRARLLAHIQNTHHQYNLPAPKGIAYKSNREGVGAGFADASTRQSVELDLAMLDVYDEAIRKLELFLCRRAKQHDGTAFHRLRTVPGIGKILAMTILYEIHDITRFERVQEFASYARLVQGTKESAGKRKGTGGAKMGNVHLKWAFSEAAVLFLAKCERGRALKARLDAKHGKAKALSILAHKIGRAVYFMLSRGTAFDQKRFLART
jgi:transposase